MCALLQRACSGGDVSERDGEHDGNMVRTWWERNRDVAGDRGGGLL